MLICNKQVNFLNTYFLTKKDLENTKKHTHINPITKRKSKKNPFFYSKKGNYLDQIPARRYDNEYFCRFKLNDEYSRSDGDVRIDTTYGDFSFINNVNKSRRLKKGIETQEGYFKSTDGKPVRFTINNKKDFLRLINLPISMSSAEFLVKKIDFSKLDRVLPKSEGRDRLIKMDKEDDVNRYMYFPSRRTEHWVRSDKIFLDFDNSHTENPEDWNTLDEVNEFMKFNNLYYALAPSKSHNIDKDPNKINLRTASVEFAEKASGDPSLNIGKSARPRMHLFLFMGKYITNPTTMDIINEVVYRLFLSGGLITDESFRRNKSQIFFSSGKIGNTAKSSDVTFAPYNKGISYSYIKGDSPYRTFFEFLHKGIEMFSVEKFTSLLYQSLKKNTGIFDRISDENYKKSGTPFDYLDDTLVQLGLYDNENTKAFAEDVKLYFNKKFKYNIEKNIIERYDEDNNLINHKHARNNKLNKRINEYIEEIKQTTPEEHYNEYLFKYNRLDEAKKIGRPYDYKKSKNFGNNLITGVYKENGVNFIAMRKMLYFRKAHTIKSKKDNKIFIPVGKRFIALKNYAEAYVMNSAYNIFLSDFYKNLFSAVKAKNRYHCTEKLPDEEIYNIMVLAIGFAKWVIKEKYEALQIEEKHKAEMMRRRKLKLFSKECHRKFRTALKKERERFKKDLRTAGLTIYRELTYFSDDFLLERGIEPFDKELLSKDLRYKKENYKKEFEEYEYIIGINAIQVLPI